MTNAISTHGNLLLIAAFLGALPLATPAQSGIATQKGQQQSVVPVMDAFTATLVRNLMASGFQVSEGYPRFYDKDACANYTYPALHSCFGNNPASPYVIPVVEAWLDEDVNIGFWLPTPSAAANFNLVFRMYWPDKTALQKKWVPPPVQIQQ